MRHTIHVRRRRTVATAVTAVLALGAAGLTGVQLASANAAGCRVDYAVSSQWPGGFGANVSVTNLGDAVDGWRLTWSFTAGQSVTQLWNGTYTQSGAQVTVSNTEWNGAIPSRGGVAFGFNGSWTGTNPTPASFSLNGVVCTGEVGGTPTPSISSPAPTVSLSTPPPTLPPPTTPPPSSGITASVSADGGYTIRAQQPAAWTFTGTVGRAVTNQRTTNGSDAVGAYQEIAFNYTDSAQRSATIRVYQNTPVVLFGSTNVTAVSNTSSAGTPFPTLTTPALPYRESFQDNAFGTYQFNGTLARDSSLLSFDGNANGFLVSAADNFAVANLTRGTNTVSTGIASSVTTLPAGFTHRTILALGRGVNTTYTNWGSALMALGGKRSIPNDAHVTLNKIGYWTDNGATYYYRYDAARGYAGTLTAAVQDLANRGVPMGYLQLDSWWYPKGEQARWQDNANQGEYVYRPAPELFPNGLPAFQRQVGVPLVTHARWIDDSSPYRQQYRMSGNVITDPAFWDSTMRYLADSGVVTYEQDWLSAGAQAQYNLADPNAFTGNMSRSAAANNLTLQYCMTRPWNYLQSSQYQNLQTTRVSGDRFERGKWDEFLFGSRLASAVGAWPWSDVFMSSETNNLLLSTLSAGMVGIGDPIGAANVANLQKVSAR